MSFLIAFAFAEYNHYAPEPAYVTPTPAYESPAYVTPAPAYVTPTPDYVKPTPDYVKPAPIFTPETPKYTPPTPAYNQPGYVAPVTSDNYAPQASESESAGYTKEESTYSGASSLMVSGAVVASLLFQ